MWLGRQGVTEEDHRVQLPGRDLTAELEVTAVRPALLPFDRQIRLLGDPFAGGAGADEVELGECRLVTPDEVDHLGFLVVVCDQCEACHGPSDARR